MDWLTQLLASLGPNAAAAAPLGGGGLAGDLGMGAIPGGGAGGMVPPVMPGFDEGGVGAPGGPPGLPPSATPAPMTPPAPEPPTLGASLEPGAPAGAPMDLRSINQKRMGGTQPQNAAPAVNNIVQALRGLQAPPRPDVVKPTSPAAPQVRGHIQSGDFLALLQSLSNPRQPVLGPQRATTLGGALGIGRY